MINPTTEDIGRRVIFMMCYDSEEEGAIIGLDGNFVNVRYDSGIEALTLHEHLNWATLTTKDFEELQGENKA